MVEDVLKFWFVEISQSQWWKKDLAFDNLIRNRFLILFRQCQSGEHLDWAETAHGSLARIIVLDQFPRNLFRETPESFTTDHLALQATKHAIAVRFDESLSLREKAFLYMPLMHSESRQDQEQSVDLFAAAGVELKANLDSALRHKKIIDRFGRFPHRNPMLGRKSTLEELEFLKQPGSRF
jgi:uncharacterized protein (DUF924 family)